MIKWLRRIFSLEFLGVVIGAASLYLAYITFANDSTPGHLCHFNVNKTFDKGIRYIFYGFEINDDSLYINNNKYFPCLVNNGPNEIVDFSIASTMKLNVNISPNRNFAYSYEQNDSTTFAKVSFAFVAERIGFMYSIPFPLDAIETYDDEIQMTEINSGVMYKDMSEDIINYFYFIVGIPKHYRDEKGEEITAEHAFIQTISPYLLYMLDNRDPNEILLIFDNKDVEAPTKLRLLRDKNMEITTINELQ